MFSSRLHWPSARNRLAETLEVKRASGVKVLDLTESNPTQAGLAYNAEGILQALAHPDAMAYRPSPRAGPSGIHCRHLSVRIGVRPARGRNPPGAANRYPIPNRVQNVGQF